jgi:hypothetical protein
MKPENVERLVVAFDKAAAEASGQPNLETAVGEVIQFLERLLAMLRRCATLDQIRSELLVMEEPSTSSLVIFEGSLRYFPRIMNGWIRSTAKIIGVTKGDMGRPLAVPPEKYRAVCTEVSAWELKGRSLGEAKKIVAKKHGVDYRTIHRIWNRRADIPEDGVFLQDAEQFIESLLADKQS